MNQVQTLTLSVYFQAAWYPEEPTKKDERQMSQFMKAFAHFYPCTWCAKDFQDNIEASPPRFVSLVPCVVRV